MWNALFRAAHLSHFTADLPENKLHIHVIDVGKADAILVESPTASVLVDTGTQNSAGDVQRYLKARGIEHLDAVILSHGDADHAGGLSKIMEEIPAEVLLCSAYTKLPDTDDLVQTALPGTEIFLSDLTLEILAPTQSFSEENDNSLVFRLRYDDFSMLFCGDIQENAEKALLESGADLRADVLKVAHHGSNTSSSTAFLQAVQPRYAVISAGEDRNLLPRNAVLKRLQTENIRFFRTDLDGSVVISADGSGEIFITTETAGLCGGE
ncbi:MAG: MBL fold metallo-hydrolase [Clostridia bacterium]|nr:MBL fold metallo-hydrolase [Clostridia bacterium]